MTSSHRRILAYSPDICLAMSAGGCRGPRGPLQRRVAPLPIRGRPRGRSSALGAPEICADVRAHPASLRFIHPSARRTCRQSPALSPATTSARSRLNISRSQPSRPREWSHGSGGGGGGGGGSARKANDEPTFMTDLIAACVRHPFELVGLRLAISSAPEYASFGTLARSVYATNSWRGLFVGVRLSILNTLLPTGSSTL